LLQTKLYLKKFAKNLLTFIVRSATLSCMKIDEKFYTPLQAAKALSVHRTTIFRWMDAGKISVTEVAGQRLIAQSEINRIHDQQGSAGTLV
jgi:excisionase family DNA binding protein